MDITKLVLEKVNPTVIRILIDHGHGTYADWDRAIATAEMYDEIEAAWRDSLLTAVERHVQFIKDGVVTQEQAWDHRIRQVTKIFEDSVRSGNTDHRARARYDALFSTGVTQDAIHRAREYPLENIISVRRGWAICPFHAEKTPSLHVTGNLYHCFGCKEGGSTIDFVMKTQDLAFPRAVRYINSL